MPAIMIKPVAGGRLVVNGRRMASVAGGPRPGRMPIKVPITTPTPTQNRLSGLNAAPKPSIRLYSAPMALPRDLKRGVGGGRSGRAEQGGAGQVDPQEV